MMDQFIVSTHGVRRYLCVEAADMALRAWYVIKELIALDQVEEDRRLQQLADYYNPYPN